MCRPHRPELREWSTIPPLARAPHPSVRNGHPGRILVSQHAGSALFRMMRDKEREQPSVVLWGAPWLRAGLETFGITCGEGRVRIAVVEVVGDADLEVLRRILADCPDARVLAVLARGTTSEHASRVLHAFELGAAAALPADAPLAEIAQAVRDLDADRDVIHPWTATLVIRALRERAVHSHQFALTTRERDVLNLLVEGLTTADIALRLGMAFNTAQSHLKSIYRKLDVCSKAAATALALRHQLVTGTASHAERTTAGRSRARPADRRSAS